LPSRVGSCPSSLAESFSSPRTLQRVMQKYSGYGEVVTVGDEDEDPQGIEKPRARVVDSNLLQPFELLPLVVLTHSNKSRSLLQN
jgi:hypothetical protein